MVAVPIGSSQNIDSDQFIFYVYTKSDVDVMLSNIERAFDEKLRAQEDRAKRALSDTVRSILLRLEQLPSEIPSDQGFYQQLRERLIHDIRRDLEKSPKATHLQQMVAPVID
ncbi:hypothetical protein A1D31_37435 [Bradyrhizobium liaoningense]|nr:hypothetical protein A1D31_37435 [Bradyrhizobium liaoningense]